MRAATILMLTANFSFLRYFAIHLHICNISFQNYSGNIANSPLPVQVALIHALALADELQSALEVLAKLSDSEK